MSSINVQGNSHPKFTRDWQEICNQVRFRRQALDQALKDIDSAHDVFKNSIQPTTDLAEVQFQIAAMDSFVEEAQQSLNTQAFRQFWWGVGLALFAVALLALGFWRIAARDIPTAANSNAYVTTMHIITAVSLSGILLIAVVFVMQLARASLHESTINYSRHHGLRFGRLYVYLFAGRLTFEQVEKAFGWTGMFSTGFQWMKFGAIKPDSTERTIAAIAELMKELKVNGKG